MPNDADYTITDLARLAGLNVRTIRYWIAQGLIPASGESGPGAHYGQGHLDRLRLIKRLQAEYLPNAEIRRRLAPLSDAEVASLVGETPDAAAPRPTTSALEYVRGLLGVSDSTPEVLPPPSAPRPSMLLRRHAQKVSRHFPVAPVTPQASIAPPPAKAGLSMPVGAPPAADDAPVHVPEGMASDAALAPRAAEPAAAGVVVGRVAQLSEAVAPAEAPETARPQPPERSQWERLSLGPNIELHVRRPLSRPEQRRVERLITIARQVLEEDN